MTSALGKVHRGLGKYYIGIVLLLGLLHGLLYLLLVPPWQHYDEPGNFEFAWLIANQTTWPKPGDYDPEMRREIFASLVENHFFDFQGISGALNSLNILDMPAWLGIPQVGDRPLYYILVSIPLRLIQYTDITFQLYVARFVSLVLFLLTIYAAWGAMGDLLNNPRHPLRWMVPVSIALLPSFVDVMTAVNNDVGAIAFFTFFLWGCIRLIKNGLTPINGVWVLITTVMCVLTKSTVYIAVPLAVIAFTFGILRDHRRKYAWISFAMIAIAGIGLTFTWGDIPSNFYVSNGLKSSARTKSFEAPDGKFVIKMDVVRENDTAQIKQPILPIILTKLEGKDVTIGGWFWADHPVEIMLPQIILSNKPVGQPVLISLDEKPQFFAYTVKIPSTPQKGWLSVSPTPKDLTSPMSIFMDGLVLAEGIFPADNPPSFSDRRGDMGLWYGKEFQNLLQNGSAERGWPSFNTQVEDISKKYIPIQTKLVWAVLDWEWSIPYFQADLGVLFRTFWAKFGWGNIPLVGTRPYRVLVIATTIGIVGAAFSMWKNKRQIDSGLFLLGFFTLIGIWGFALFRGLETIFEYTWYPVARYGYPSILFTIGILTLGWFTVLDSGLKYLRLPRKLLTVVYTLLFLIFSIIALLSLLRYYSAY